MSASTFSQRPATARVSSPLVHLLWKEFRAQRTLVFTLMLVGVFAQLLLRMFVEVRPGNSAATYIFAAVYFVPLMVAVGSSVLLFAWEKEEKTWNLLRVLPMSRNDLFFAKFGLGLLVTVASFGLLWLTAWMLAPQPYPAEKHRVVLQWGLNSLMLYMWGVLFSLLTGRVLTALVAAPLCMIISMGLPFSFLLIPVLAVVDYWLTGRWLDDKPLPVPTRLLQRKTRAVPKSFLSVTDASEPWKVSFSRLIWIEWQNAKSFLKLILAAGMIVVLFGSMEWFHLAFSQTHVPFMFLLLVPLLAGVWSFHGEQQQKRFRLAAYRGVSAQPLWLSKHLVWIPVAVLAGALLILFQLLLLFFVLQTRMMAWADQFFANESILSEISDSVRRGERHVPGLGEVGGTMLLYVAIAYACGQFASLMVPRTVTAAILSLPMLVVATTCWGLLTAFGVPTSWTLGPIVVVLFLATLLRSPDWLLERRGWRRWIKIAVTLLFPLPFIVAGLAAFRVTEIPTQADPRSDSYALLDGKPYMWLLGQFERGFREQPFIQRAVASWTLPKGTYSYVGGDVTVAALQQERSKLAFDDAAALFPTAESDRLLAFVREQTRLAEEDRTNRSTYQFRDAMERRMRNYMDAATDLTAAGKLDEATAALMLGAQLMRLYSEHGNVFMFTNDLQRQGDSFRQTLLAWLNHPDQTPERVLAMTRVMDAEFSQFEMASKKVLENRTFQLGEFRSDWDASVAELNAEFGSKQESTSTKPSAADQSVGALIRTRRFFPWEKFRIERLINITSAAILHETMELDRKLMPGNREDLAEWLVAKKLTHYDMRRMEPWKWWLTTLAPPVGWATWMTYPESLYDLLNASIQQECRNRAMVLTGALVAYRLKNHKLPESLDMLVPEYLSEVPTDPWSGRNFGYRPNGFPMRLKTSSDNELGPEIPLLWSNGIYTDPVEQKWGDRSSEFLFGSRPGKNLYSLANARDARPLVIPIPMGRQPVKAAKPVLPSGFRPASATDRKSTANSKYDKDRLRIEDIEKEAAPVGPGP